MVWPAERENGPRRAMFLREGALASIIFWLRGDWLRRRRLQIRSRHELEVSRAGLRRWYLPAVGLLAIVLSLGPASRASIRVPSPLAAPVIESCEFVPDPRVNASFVCGTDNSLVPGFPNASMSFRVTVSGETNLSVVFSFDYLNAGGVPNPNSPNRTVGVPFPGLGKNATVETNWTYMALNQNYTSGNTSSTYWVHVEVRDETGQVGNWSQPFFPVIVNQNSAPFIDGLLSLTSVTQALMYWNPVIPLLYENVSIGDPDSDPVTLTWDWGDGTLTVNHTGPLTTRMALNVSHQYLPSRFPLNESPHYVDIPVSVWIDDGLGHNVSYNSTAEFYIATDFPPSVHVERLFSATWSPQSPVGSVWKVGEPVHMIGNVTDPERDPTTAYWDFDNRTDNNGDGDPTRDRDANGTTAIHVYTAPGNYSIVFWATDGEQKTCLNANCTNPPPNPPFVTHWQNDTIPIQVIDNRLPYLALSNTTLQVGEPSLLRATVRDSDGDSMAVTWVFGDGSANATNVTGTSSRASPLNFVVLQEHAYLSPGPFNLTLYVSDGNDTVNDTKQVFVESLNLPPVLLGLHASRANGMSAGNNTFRINEIVVVTAQMYDKENDTLNASIEWGDGSVENSTIDPKTSNGCSSDNQSRNICSVSFSHAYASSGANESREYTVLVTITDNKVYLELNATGATITLTHTKNQTVIVIITGSQSRSQELGPWDWWDYTTFAMVLGIPGLLIARFAWKVHLERREE